MPTLITPHYAKSFTTSLRVSQSAEFAELFGVNTSEVSDVATLYREVGFFRACVALRAQAVSEVPWAIYRSSGQGEAVYTSDSVGQPPREIGWARYLKDITRRSEQSVALTGAAFWRKDMTGTRVTNLSYLSPGAVTAYFESGRVARFQYDPQGGYGDAGTFSPEQIVWVWDSDPFIEVGHYGASDGGSARRAATVLRELEIFATSFLRKGALKATILKDKAQFRDPDERNKLRQWWKSFISGSRNAGDVRVLSDEIEAQVIGDGLGDLEVEEITRDQKRSVAQAFGIPLSIIMSDAANHATAQQDELNFLRYTVVPSARTLADAINAHVLEPQGLQMIVEDHRIPAYARAQRDGWAGVQEAVGRSTPLLTREEGREIIGWDATPSAGSFADPLAALVPGLRARLKARLPESAYALVTQYDEARG